MIRDIWNAVVAGCRAGARGDCVSLDGSIDDGYDGVSGADACDRISL